MSQLGRATSQNSKLFISGTQKVNIICSVYVFLGRLVVSTSTWYWIRLTMNGWMSELILDPLENNLLLLYLVPYGLVSFAYKKSLAEIQVVCTKTRPVLVLGCALGC